MAEWHYVKQGDKPDVKRLPNGNLDPVFELNGKYGWFDETWADSYGPFDTREAADESVTRYAREVLGA